MKKIEDESIEKTNQVEIELKEEKNKNDDIAQLEKESKQIIKKQIETEMAIEREEAKQDFFNPAYLDDLKKRLNNLELHFIKLTNEIESMKGIKNEKRETKPAGKSDSGKPGKSGITIL